MNISIGGSHTKSLGNQCGAVASASPHHIPSSFFPSFTRRISFSRSRTHFPAKKSSLFYCLSPHPKCHCTENGKRWMHSGLLSCGKSHAFHLLLHQVALPSPSTFAWSGGSAAGRRGRRRRGTTSSWSSTW